MVSLDNTTTQDALAARTNEVSSGTNVGTAIAIPCWVYFIRRSGDGAIKIGRSVNAEKRRRGLQTASPDELTILGKVPGGSLVESEWHDRFRPSKIRGEWFTPGADLLSAISEAIGVTVEPLLVPSPTAARDEMEAAVAKIVEQLKNPPKRLPARERLVALAQRREERLKATAAT